MKVLVIKTSSMGDIIHSLPALTDAGKAINGIRFDWVVEEAFADIPRLHPLVDKVIPVELRRWRKNPWRAIATGDWARFRQQLRQRQYDLVIDAQGLVKSAFLTRFARGKRCGLDRHSAWESLASFVYQQTVAVDPKQHAITRVRKLFAGALDYEFIDTEPDYALDKSVLPNIPLAENALILIHGTTWATKCWPESYWQQLAKQAAEHGMAVYIPWGNEEEHARSKRIANHTENVTILPKYKLQELASILSQAKAAVAVDTGLGHLAAALALPTISLYGPTDPSAIGTRGAGQIHLAADFQCAPCEKQRCKLQTNNAAQPACFASITSQQVWQKLQELI